MSKIILYTVQGKPNMSNSVADKTGLSAYLGYRPLFCTKLDPNSLEESWFRIWAASPRYPEEICIFEAEESDCIPVNVVDWTNKCLDYQNVTADIIKSTLHDKEPLMTDYLVKKLPDNCVRIPITSLFSNPEPLMNFGATYFGKNDFMKRVIACLAVACHEAAITYFSDNNQSITYMAIYTAIIYSGFIPMFWSVATKTPADIPLYTITPELFQYQFSFLNSAQMIRDEWDSFVGEKEFSYERYYEMRDMFKRAINGVAKKLSMDNAKTMHVGRNDECPCGSGKKYKTCHGNITLDAWVNSPIFLTKKK